MIKKTLLIIFIGTLSFLGFKSIKTETIAYEKQIKIFKTLGYEFVDGVNKEMILTDGYAEPMWDQIRKERLKKLRRNRFHVFISTTVGEILKSQS